MNKKTHRSTALKERFNHDPDFRERHAAGLRAHHQNHPMTVEQKAAIGDSVRWRHHDRYPHGLKRGHLSVEHRAKIQDAVRRKREVCR